MIGELELLHKLYGTIHIPQAVYDEVVIQGQGQPGDTLVKNSDWIIVLPVLNELLVKSLSLELDKGEAEAIALAIETEADLVLLDEKRGRTIASHFKLRPLGLLGILVLAKKKNLIPFVKPLVDNLRNQAGFWIDNKLYHHVLSSVNE